MFDRTKILNKLIQKHNYQTYLEIGIDKGENYPHIECPHKLGVDPNPAYNEDETIINTYSDRFFGLVYTISPHTTFDLVFIDGAHYAEQCMKDVAHALQFLSVGGTIVIHDVNPKTEKQQKVPREQEDWTGDVWRVFSGLTDLFTEPRQLYTLDVETGLGILQPHKITARDTKEIQQLGKEILKNDPLSYCDTNTGFHDFYKSKTRYLRLRSANTLDQ